MKNHYASLHLPIKLALILALRINCPLLAQPFTNLYNFSDLTFGPSTNADGVGPEAALVLSGNILYGTATAAGSSGQGTVFSVNIDGTGFSTLHDFTQTNSPNGSNLDGAVPVASLLLSGNTLYGTATAGGSSGSGTIFALNIDGTGFRTLHSFTTPSTAPSGLLTNADGGYPAAGLVVSSNVLYGTTEYGGTSGNGTVFAMNTDGTGFTTLHAFTATDVFSANNDGANPTAQLVLANGVLYGTTSSGGSGGNGTIFAITTNGSNFQVLHEFSVGTNDGLGDIFNTDGAYPYSTLLLIGRTLYGTASDGGSSGSGTLFAINTDGLGFTTMYSFTGGLDGYGPLSGMIFSGDMLYGTTSAGGYGWGTVFAINTNGTGFTNLYRFAHSTDGSKPDAGLVISGDLLFGAAHFGGEISGTAYGNTTVSLHNGSIFAINTNGTGFTNIYQFTLDLQPRGINNDGALPWSGLVLSGSRLYGTTELGGATGYGTLFSVNTDGTNFKMLHSFMASSLWDFANPRATNSDGESPSTGLICSGNTLFGSAPNGGDFGYGTLFSIGVDGAGFRVLHSFTDFDTDGAGAASLAISGASLYGTSGGGGAYGHGSLFVLGTNGGGYTTLYSFTGRTDAGDPAPGPVLYGTTMYGATAVGGIPQVPPIPPEGAGTVFKIATDGSGFTTLHVFPSPEGPGATNLDGAYPNGSLILAGDTLYGTAQRGGLSGNGAVFKVKNDGSGFAILHSFTAAFANGYDYPNNDGASPMGALVLSGNTLYGTAFGGGTFGFGSLFAINTDGTGFTNLYSFPTTDGFPVGGLVLSGNTLYGTASAYGSIPFNGTIFSLSLGASQEGSVLVTISPPDAVSAGAQWQLDAGAYQNSGATQTNVSAGLHNIYFSPPPAWVAPSNLSVIITNGVTTVINAIFTPAKTGSLQVTLAPAILNLGGVQWQVDRGAFQNSEAIVSGLTPGIHTVSFTSINGWLAPTNQTVVIGAGIATTITSTYIPMGQPNGFDYRTNNGTITILGYAGPTTVLPIPASINGLPVAAIWQYAFMSNSTLIAVSIPEGITSIGTGAFFECTNLFLVIAGSTLTNIGDRAFDSCSNLRGVSIPNGLPTVPDSIFSLCVNLTNVTIANGVTTIGSGAFINCFSLAGISLPNGIASIGWSAFFQCYGLRDVRVPDSVTNIGFNAFSRCLNLSSATIGKGVTTVGAWAFAYCPLSSIVIPPGVVSIGDSAFEGSSITSVTIPNSVASLGTNAFQGTGLVRVIFGTGISNIGAGAFSSCPSLTSIYFIGNPPSADSTVFSRGTVYYLPDTTGWYSPFGGVTAVLWNPSIQLKYVSTNGLSFNVTGSPNIPLVIEATTNLSNDLWSTILSGTLTNGIIYFTDPQWTDYSTRFYRARAP